MYPLKIVFLGSIVGAIILIIGIKIVKSKILRKNTIYEIQIKINEKEIKTTAILDTGNMLKDPITGNPVIIVEKEELKKIIPEEILENIDSILGGEINKIESKIENKFLSKLKIIPYSSLGKENGILLGIKSDEVYIINEDKKYKKENIIIGIYNRKLTKKGEYKALIGMDLI